MKKIALVVLLPILASCDGPETTVSESETTPVAASVEAEASLAPPRTDEFSAAWAQACPQAEPVGSAVCKSLGLTEPNFTCDFSLGDDDVRRHTAQLTPGDGVWLLDDPSSTCSIGE